MEESKFRVIHPFHPLSEREFDIVDYTTAWGEGRVFFHDDENLLKSLPARWTSIAPINPYVQIAAGRCTLRLPELLELANLVKDIKDYL